MNIKIEREKCSEIHTVRVKTIYSQKVSLVGSRNYIIKELTNIHVVMYTYMVHVHVYSTLYALQLYMYNT